MEFNLSNEASECLNSAIINFHFNKKEKINTIRFCRQAIYKYAIEFNINSKFMNIINNIQKNLLENIFESLDYYKEFILDLDDKLQENEILKYNKIFNHYVKLVLIVNYTNEELKKFNFTFNAIIQAYQNDQKKIYLNLQNLYKN